MPSNRKGIKAAWDRFRGEGTQSNGGGSSVETKATTGLDPEDDAGTDDPKKQLADALGVSKEDVATYGVEVTLDLINRANESRDQKLNAFLAAGAGVNLQRERPDDWVKLVPITNTVARSGYFLRVVELDRTKAKLSPEEKVLILSQLAAFDEIDGTDEKSAIVSMAFSSALMPTTENGIPSGWPPSFREAISLHLISGLQKQMQATGLSMPPSDLMAETFWFGYMVRLVVETRAGKLPS